MGIKAKYDGGVNTDDRLTALCAKRLVIPACPEQLGGLSTPRPPCEIRGGTGEDVLAGRARVVNPHGDDLTELFLEGARETLRLCRICGVRAAILKERSPSCGVNIVYDGTFQSVRLNGRGVTAALLAAHGIHVYSEEDLTPELIRTLFQPLNHSEV